MPHQKLRKNEFLIRFMVFSGIIGLFILPIIHANMLYADDHLRAFDGCVSFGDTGRIEAELLFYIVHMNFHISDVGFFFQVCSIFILSAPLALLSLRLNYNRLSSFLALPFIVCTPFFLQNLSYRYDSLIMSISLALAILAVCSQLKHRYFYAILLLFFSLGFYQASFSAFLILSCLAAFWYLFDTGIKASVFYNLKAFLCGAAALVLYKIQLFIFSQLPIITFKIRNYGAEHSEVNFHITHMFKNIIFGLRYCFIDFNKGGVPLALSFCVILSIIFLFLNIFIFSNRQNEKIKKIVFFVWGITLFLISMISIIGIMALLDQMIIGPRVCVGIGSFLALCFSSFFIGRNLILPYLDILRISVCCFALFEIMFGSFVYSNALFEENEFDVKLVDQMIKDTYYLVKDKPVFIRYMNLNQPFLSKKTAKAYQFQPWIEEIAGGNYGMFWYYNGPQIWHEEGALTSMNVEGSWRTKSHFSEDEAQNILLKCNYDRTIAEPYYALYQKGDKIVIDFASTCSNS